jgi:NADH-quinone oxidoreductase subunit F
MVFNTETDLMLVLRRLAHFFAHESCGKCYPCQLGTQRQMEILDAADGPLSAADRARLADIDVTMTAASICGLGQTAAMAIQSAFERWPDRFGEG